MESQRCFSSKQVIGVSCSAFIFLMVYVNSSYGIAGTTAVLLLSQVLLQPFKIVYEHVAIHGKYGLKLAIRTTNCWTIYQILNTSLITAVLLSISIMLAESEALHIPKTIWLVVIILLACCWSMKPIQPFVRKENYNGMRPYPTKLISAFVPRFVLLYTFVVYYFIAYVDSTEMPLIPSLCVVYLGVDRLITMFNTVKTYERQEYYSLFRDTVKWMRRVRKMDTK